MNMTNLQRSAIVAAFVKECHGRDVFCGETMVQKATFFLQELRQVPLEFEYQLYIYGPFSFDLQRHLNLMLSDDMLAVRPLGYGSTFEPAEQIAWLEQHAGKAVNPYRHDLAFVVDKLGNRGVKQLERLATALYFSTRNDDATVDVRARMICDVKPHITLGEAREAVDEVDLWRRESAA